MSPNRDSTGGVYSRFAAPRFTRPEGVPKLPSANGRNGVGNIQPNKVFRFQSLQGDAFQERVAGIERLPNHVVFGVIEARVRESHRLGQEPEDLDVWLRFARSGQRRPGHLHIVVAVGEIEVGVFQERRDRQDDVGVIGGVGLELLQNDGEQIFPPQPARTAV